MTESWTIAAGPDGWLVEGPDNRSDAEMEVYRQVSADWRKPTWWWYPLVEQKRQKLRNRRSRGWITNDPTWGYKNYAKQPLHISSYEVNHPKQHDGTEPPHMVTEDVHPIVTMEEWREDMEIHSRLGLGLERIQSDGIARVRLPMTLATETRRQDPLVSATRHRQRGGLHARF